MAKRSVVSGLVSVFAVGYVFGITRANFPEMGTFFTFDAAVVAFYVVHHKLISSSFHSQDGQRLRHWVMALMLWPFILFFIPLQDPLIQAVGLRGNIFLLPFVLIGAKLEDDEIYSLGLSLAMLNIFAFTIGATEYFTGIQHFYPQNAVTDIIYRSNDVGINDAYRIPAIFANAHSYGGTMVLSLPLVVGAWIQRHKHVWHKNVLLVGMLAAILGVFMSAARSHFLALSVLIMVFTLSASLRPAYRVGWLIILLVVGYMVAASPRLQRFTTLNDEEYVDARIRSSVNAGLFDALYQYPFGNGLGGGGTSVPYFLADKVERPFAMESELGRMQLETGLIGVAGWIGFVVWVFMRPRVPRTDPWFVSLRMAFFVCAWFFVIGLIGIGLLTSIPSSAMMLMFLGWLGTRHTKAQPSLQFAPANFAPPLHPVQSRGEVRG